MSPSPSSSSSSMSFPIVIIAIVGIMGTAAFLFIYYVFVIKCCLNIRFSQPELILRRFSRSRRRRQRFLPFTAAAAAAVDRHHGLDPAAIRAIPTFRYSPSADRPAGECAVCLLEFREDERLRRLTGCGHGFHIDCIDAWLEANANCPLCRAAVRRPAEERVVIEMRRKPAAKAGSKGDECVEVRREKDESFVVQPIRRSFSMDSAGDRKLLEAVREALRRNPEVLGFREEGSSSNGGGRGQRLFVSLGGWRSGRSSRRAVHQSVQAEV